MLEFEVSQQFTTVGDREMLVIRGFQGHSYSTLDMKEMLELDVLLQ